MEQLLPGRSMYGWLALLAALAYQEPGDDGDRDAFIAACPLAVALVDLASGRVVAASPSFPTMMGLPDDSSQWPDAHRLVPDPELLDALIALLGDGAIDSYHAHRAYRRPDGGTTEAHSWVAVTDLVERHRALWVVAPVGEEPDGALPEVPPDRWLATVPDVVMAVISVDLRFEHVSGAARDLLGVEPDDLAERSFVEVVHPDDVPELYSATAVALRLGASTVLELRVADAAGGWSRVHALLLPFSGREPQRFGMLLAPAPDPDLEAAGEQAGPRGGGRLGELERRLWRIAREVELSGVVAPFERVPDAEALPALRDLSTRQWDVLTRLLRGERVPQIARELFLSQSTVRNHLTEMFRKLGVHSQEELLALVRSGARPGPPG